MRKLFTYGASVVLALFLITSAAHAGIGRRCEANNNSNSTPMSINVCNTTADGDMMVLGWTEFNSPLGAAIPIAPSPWLPIGTGHFSAGADDTRAFDLYYHQALSEPASYSVTAGNATGFMSGGIAVYTGMAAGLPVEVFSNNGGTTSPAVGTAVSPSLNDDILLSLVWVDLTGISMTPPGGYTTEWNISSTGSVFGSSLVDKILSASGSTGNVSTTESSNANWGAILAALRSAASFTPNTPYPRCRGDVAHGGNIASPITVGVCANSEIQSGYLMVMPVAYYNNVTLTTPSGWTKCASCDAVASTRIHASVYYKYAGAGESAVSLAWTGGSNWITAQITAFTNTIGTGNPFDAVSTNPINAGSTTWTANSVTTNVANDYLMLFYAVENSNVAQKQGEVLQYPSGYDQIQPGITGDGFGSAVGGSALSSAGPTGNQTVSCSPNACDSTDYVGVQMAILGPTPTPTPTPAPTPAVVCHQVPCIANGLPFGPR